MALPNVDTAHEHALKTVVSVLETQRGKDALPKDLVDKLREIAEAKLDPTPNKAKLFDSTPATMAKGKLKANQAMVDELGGKVNIDKAVNAYNNIIDGMLKANGYKSGLGAA